MPEAFWESRGQLPLTAALCQENTNCVHFTAACWSKQQTLGSQIFPQTRTLLYTSQLQTVTLNVPIHKNQIMVVFLCLGIHTLGLIFLFPLPLPVHFSVWMYLA